MGTGANSDYLPDLIFESGEWKNIQSIVCIPACNEVSLIPVLQSINQCDAVSELGCVIVINSAENADESIEKVNLSAFKELEETYAGSIPLKALLYSNLPVKKAGVGLARKLAMDKACESFHEIKKNNILLCLDADCTVENNWAKEVVNYFKINSEINAASVYFEHPMPEDEVLKNGITLYELHLRYLKRALQWTGFPWYYHTVGSSMALRAETYLKSGGMNTRQAGEDFYFLHKLMPLGFGEINSTTVYPAARFSDRVPFGTGRSMIEFEQNRKLLTYNFEIFRQLRTFFQWLNSLKKDDFSEWEKHASMAFAEFLKTEGIEKAWSEAIENAATFEKGKERFWKWFSGFRTIKALHYLRDSGFEDGDVSEQAGLLLKVIDKKGMDFDLLKVFRNLDKNE